MILVSLDAHRQRFCKDPNDHQDYEQWRNVVLGALRRNAGCFGLDITFVCGPLPQKAGYRDELPDFATIYVCDTPLERDFIGESVWSFWDQVMWEQRPQDPAFLVWRNRETLLRNYSGLS